MKSKQLKSRNSDNDDAVKKALGKHLSGNLYDDPDKISELVKGYEKGKLSDGDLNIVLGALNQFDFETGKSFLMAIPQPYEPMMLRLRNKIIEEYDCKTHLEYALSDTIAMAYIRILQQGYLLNGMVSDGVLSEHQIEVMKMASKEADRANRNLLSATQTLLQIKSKPINIQIKNAYMANQQVNQSPS